jgi:hypothetical protein
VEQVLFFGTTFRNGESMSRLSNDDRSDSMNPNNDAYHDSMDNRSNQLNPNADKYSDVWLWGEWQDRSGADVARIRATQRFCCTPHGWRGTRGRRLKMLEN